MNVNEIKKLFTAGRGQYYQSFPEKIKEVLKLNSELYKIDAVGHYEKERFSFIIKHVDFNNMKVLDIGANQGYFSFEAIGSGASKALIVEGRKDYTDFISKLSSIMGYDISVENSYLDFSKDLIDNYFSIIYNLNVIHHLGGDFGDSNLAKQQALKEMGKTFKYLHNKSKYMIFSMGFNWKGDESEPLFENGTKEELIKFVQNSIEYYYTVKAIGIAERNNSTIEYRLLSEDNINRDDSLGEFLNRPLFILESNFKKEKHQ